MLYLHHVNLPIIIEGKTVGVVSVYGNPDEVRITAMLVKMATELLLEREIILERFSSRQKAKEYLVLNLISRETTLNEDSIVSLEKQASLIGYNLHLPRAVVAGNIEIERGRSAGYLDLVQNKTRENILSLMEKSAYADEQDLVVVLNDKLLYLINDALLCKMALSSLTQSEN